MNSELFNVRSALLAPLVLLGISATSFSAVADFAGEWETTYGRLTLKADGERVSGTYVGESGAANKLSGTVSDRTLTFTYTEQSESGEGRFELSAGGNFLEGSWRATGTETWSRWTGKRSVKVTADFTGLWQTSFGPMRLVQTGEKIEGTYQYTGPAEISGMVSDRTFTFTYREPDGSTGKGSFSLADGGASFSGTWTADQGGGGEWTGGRTVPRSDRVWLVVLEARWEASLREPEYSYGEMLRHFFARTPEVQVRQRYFTGRADFTKWCAELAYFDEPVVLYISSHGEELGISVGGEVLDGKFIGEQLRLARTLRLIHLGACLAMKGRVPTELREASALDVPISGYTLKADWAGSAVIDFAYLDLVLVRRMAPADAVRQLQTNVTFANETSAPDSAIAPAGLKLVP